MTKGRSTRKGGQQSEREELGVRARGTQGKRFITCLVGAACGLFLQSEALPSWKLATDRVGMPTLAQHDPGFPGGGQSYCAPTAAANGLLWLADRGYPAVKPAPTEQKSAECTLILSLASYMGTDRNGTPLASFQGGITSYLRSVGYAPKAWETSGQAFRRPPDLQLLTSRETSTAVLWLGLGWYRFDARKQKYTRTNGHWVTLAGCGVRRDDTETSSGLVVADPEAPNGFRHVTAHRLRKGNLTNGRTKIPAEGYHYLAGMAQQATDRVCIVESIQVMHMP